VVPFLAAAVAIGAGALLWSQFQQIRQKEHQLQITQEQNRQLETQSQELTQKLTVTQGQLKSQDDRITALRRELSSASESFEHSRASLDELQKRYEQLNETHTRLETQLASVTGERDEARRRTERLEQEHAELSSSAVHLRERMALLERDYRQAADQLAQLQAMPNRGVTVVTAAGSTTSTASPATSQGPFPSLIPGTVELPPIVVRKDQAGMSLPVRGRVAEINEPHQFIVIDKGSLDGVQLGMVLDIVRGTTTVGRATVVRVRPKLAACDIVRSRSPGPIQVGDQVVQHGMGAP